MNENDQREEIKRNIDIVTLINKTCRLTKAGDSWRGATSASSKSGKSLIVDEKKQIYNNMATEDGGDVFNWIAYRENLNIVNDFPEILRIAAEEAGIVLEYQENVNYEEKKEVHTFLNAVAEHYHSMLTDEHREYVKKQWGISDDTINQLKIGYAPKMNTIQKEMGGVFAHATIAKSGMVYVNKNFFTDVFKGRIMFPYWKNGNVVYFIGRDPEHNKESNRPKYKKQPVHSEKYPYVSEIINNNTFYGEDSIRGHKECYIVEGITDCIKCIENGIPCISPVTVRIKESEKEHAYKLVKNMDCVYICNDTEDNNSGLNGAIDTTEFLESKGVNTKIIEMPMPDGLNKIDVAEFLKSHTKEEFEALKTNASNSIWEIKLRTMNVPESTIDKTRTIIDFINNDLARMDDSIKLPFLKTDVCEYFGITRSEMNETIKNAKTNANNSKRKSNFFDDIGKFMVKSMADFVMSKNHYITMEDTQDIFYYYNGKYVPMGERIIARTVQATLQNASSKHVIDETINYIQNETVVSRKAITNDYTKINLLNGVYDILTGTLVPHDPDVIFITQLPIKYDPDAECPNIEKFMEDVMQPDDIVPMYEFIGYCMIPDTRLQRSVMLVGNGANGKSVLLGLVGSFIGVDNVSGESLHQLENDPYSIAELYGKLVNIFPDLAEQNIYKNEAFKMLTGNEENGMRARRIYGQPFKFKNTARLIFSANKPPSVTTDDNYAYFRRWMIFEFLNTFSGEDADKNLIHKLTTESEMSGLFNVVIRYLKQLLDNDDYSYNKHNEETERLYRLKSDPIAVFSKEMVVFSEDDCRKMVMYDAYTKWCNENTIEVKAENIFAKRFGKMHEAGREVAPGPDGKRQKVWLSCGIRHGSVTVDFDNRDDKKTATGYSYFNKNNNTSLQNPICLLKREQNTCDNKFLPYGITYRENRDGLAQIEDKNDIKQSSFESSRLGLSIRDVNRDKPELEIKINEVNVVKNTIAELHNISRRDVIKITDIGYLCEIEGVMNWKEIIDKMLEYGHLLRVNPEAVKIA